MNANDKVGLQAEFKVEVESLGSALVIGVGEISKKGKKTTNSSARYKGRLQTRSYAVKASEPPEVTITLIVTEETKKIVKWVEDNVGLNSNDVERKELTYKPLDESGNEVQGWELTESYPYDRNYSSAQVGSQEVSTIKIMFVGDELKPLA